MPTPTYTALATRELTSTATSVTFSNIPATYRDLIFIWSGSGSTSAELIIRANGDSSSVYSRVVAQGNGTSASSSAATLSAFYPKFISTSLENIVLQFMDYSATDKHKNALNRSNGAGSYVDMSAFRWANTSAINSLAVTLTGGNFAIGSTFSLYGVIA
jgi:hypothetical protein